MAASANVSQLIADYFKLIHQTLIWPALASPDGKKGGPNTDNFDSFRRALTKTYSRTSSMYGPDGGSRTPCEDNRPCRQDEECIDGFCTPVGGGSTASFAAPEGTCRDNRGCREDQECIDGRCVPGIGGDVIPGDPAVAPIYDSELSTVLEEYYGRLHALMTRNLVTDPKSLPKVRTILMELYCDCAKASGATLTECSGPGGCADGSACVKGLCVPIPFRLVWSPTRFRAPW